MVYDSLLVSWAWNSEFYHKVQAETSRISRRWTLNDPLEPLPEVWGGLQMEFVEGQVLVGREIGRMRIIILRRISNYYKSKVGRPPTQPKQTFFDHPDIDNIKSPLDPPDQAVADQELFGMIEAFLSEMPAYRAEAVRSRFGFPGAPPWNEFSKITGTTRQNVAKHLKKGLEQLKLRFGCSSSLSP